MIYEGKHVIYKLKKSVIVSRLYYKPKGKLCFWKELTTLHKDGAALADETLLAIAKFEALFNQIGKKG